MRLHDKIAVVTGAGRGLGREIALRFADEGADLVVAYHADREAAEQVAGEIKGKGRRARVVHADVADRAAVRALFRETEETFGRIDILVNNAGINQRLPFLELTDDDWDRIMAVNLKGPFICCQEVFPVMQKQKGGRIINISSVAGEYHGPKTVHYAVSKAGLNSLTKVLARYGAAHNIHVNAVAPGLVLTEQTRGEFDSGAAQGIIDMTLLKRPGDAGDVADACVFLASDDQNYMTGQVISVSGGAILG
jgi:3-oxoacyl-[acyl-carrier protein] reductase